MENSCPIACNEITKLCKRKIDKIFTYEDYEFILKQLEVINKYENELIDEIMESDPWRMA
jgi:hypothetical protein